MSNIVLRGSQVLFHLIFTITLWGRYYYYPCFIDEETEAQRINLPKVTLLDARTWTEPGNQSLCSWPLDCIMKLSIEPKNNSADLLCYEPVCRESETLNILVPLPNSVCPHLASHLCDTKEPGLWALFHLLQFPRVPTLTTGIDLNTPASSLPPASATCLSFPWLLFSVGGFPWYSFSTDTVY